MTEITRKQEKRHKVSIPEQEISKLSIVLRHITDMSLPQLPGHDTLTGFANPPDIPKCLLGQTSRCRQVMASSAHDVNGNRV